MCGKSVEANSQFDGFCVNPKSDHSLPRGGCRKTIKMNITKIQFSPYYFGELLGV